MKILRLDDLIIDPAIQLQARGVETETVQAYVEAISGGADFPPAVAFNENGDLWLADGFHRVAAWRFCGKSEVPVDIRDGTRTDALVYAATANAEHGKPMSRREKREAGDRLIALREQGELDAVFKETRHPYTVSLFRSIPQLHTPADAELTPIDGQPPNPAELPPGCAFETRCYLARGRADCRTTVPKLARTDREMHLTACHYWQELTGKRASE